MSKIIYHKFLQYEATSYKSYAMFNQYINNTSASFLCIPV